jgi:predicted dehydrogenase
MIDDLHWGILATGLIAGLFTADLLRMGHKVAAVGSRSDRTANRFAEQFGIAKAHGSYEALFADPEVDIIYIAAPHPFHAANAIAALEAGKHVLVEKPFTINAAEAQKVMDVAERKGLVAMEAMWTRFLPHVARIRELLAEGALGEIVTVIADHGQWFPEDREHRLFAPELAGGALLDLGVYPVAFASMVLGQPSEIRSIVTPAFTGVDGQTSMLLGYASGAHAVLTCTLAAKSATRAAIVGTQARIEVEGDFYAPARFTLTARDGEQVSFDGSREGRGLRFEADEVARCLREGLLESPRMPLDESVAIMETMDAVLAGAVRI